jgi:hypothetical protein
MVNLDAIKLSIHPQPNLNNMTQMLKPLMEEEEDEENPKKCVVVILQISHQPDFQMLLRFQGILLNHKLWLAEKQDVIANIEGLENADKYKNILNLNIFL